MSLYVNTTLIGAIAFIMVFTYTAEAVFFLDQTSISGNISSITPQRGFPVSKVDWINIQWNFAYDKQYGVKTYEIKYGSLPKIKDPGRFDEILNDCQYHRIFIDCQSLLLVYPYPDYGYIVYSYGSGNEDKYHMSIHLVGQLDEGYAIYCRNLGYTTEGGAYEKNLIENAMSFLGQIPSGVGKFLDVLTFNIKSEYETFDADGNVVVGETNVIPTEVTVILNLFFIPMWIILAIEIVPLLAKIIEAIGALIPL
jgi:hypothetical protein